MVFWYDNYKDLETELKQVVATSKELLAEASHQKEQVERVTKERDILLQRIEGLVAQNESAAKKIETLQVKVELLELENYQLKEAAGITLSEGADIYEPPTFEELTNTMHMSPVIAARVKGKRRLELMSVGSKSRQIELAARSSSKIFSSRKAIGDKRERAHVHVKLFKEGPAKHTDFKVTDKGKSTSGSGTGDQPPLDTQGVIEYSWKAFLFNLMLTLVSFGFFGSLAEIREYFS